MHAGRGLSDLLWPIRDDFDVQAARSRGAAGNCHDGPADMARSDVGDRATLNRCSQVPLFVVGSSTSRSQSPTMLMDNVVKKIVHPGTPAIHHAFRR